MDQLIKTLKCNEQQQWFNMVTTKWQIDSNSIRMEVGKHKSYKTAEILSCLPP